MKIGDFGMSRHIALTKRPDGSTSLVRQLSTGEMRFFNNRSKAFLIWKNLLKEIVAQSQY